MAMNQIFGYRSAIDARAIQIGSATMSDSMKCMRDDQNRRKVQRPIRQIGTCVNEIKMKTKMSERNFLKTKAK
jgi:hypothetical protein